MSPRFRRWLDFNRPILVACAALLAAVGTDLATHPSALRLAVEIPILVALLVVFVWRLSHIGDVDEPDADARRKHYDEPGTNARIVRRKE